MTPIREILEDGTRVYTNGVRYKPVAPADRVNGVNKPDVPGAVRFHGLWFPPLVLLPEQERRMPLTRPDSAAAGHRARCACEVCKRPETRTARRTRANRVRSKA